MADPAELTYPAIAVRMGLSLSRVDKIRKQLFDRYCIRSKGGLVRLARELGLG